MLYLSRAGYKDGASFRDRKVIKFGSNINISFQREGWGGREKEVGMRAVWKKSKGQGTS